MLDFVKLIQLQFDAMCKTGRLYRSTVTGSMIWDLYLQGFGDDPIFRDPESSIHRCNLCNNFIRRYGNIVAIINNKIVTMFDVEAPEEYAKSAKLISDALKSVVIADVFVETFNKLNALPYGKITKNQPKFKLGIDKNIKRYTKEEAEKFGVVKANETKTFNHLHLFIPTEFIYKQAHSAEAVMAIHRDNKNVFQRGLEEISLDTLQLVKDLIQQGSLLDGETHLKKVEGMITYAEAFTKISPANKDNWCWENSTCAYAKFRNELIGVLCLEVAEGDLNKACINWNKRVDPANYMKAVAPITKKQIEEAKKFVSEKGYEASFIRRCASLDDIKASEILHLNVGDGKLKNVSIFDDVKVPNKASKVNTFDGVEEVTIEKFMKDILPSCTLVEAYLLGSHKNNMVTLTTSDDKESKPIFKWDNNYSWTYNGNLAGKSMIAQAVKSAGGKIDAPFRFSIMWNEDGRDIVDFDAMAVEPNGNTIYYARRGPLPSTGQLDVDMIRPKGTGIENIFWTDMNKVADGEYKLSIKNFDRGRNKGFKAELFINGQSYLYERNKEMLGTITVAVVTMKNGVAVDIKHGIDPHSSNAVSEEIYGINSNEFHKVKLVCTSPNHWDKNEVGNKHYFFMLEGCKSPVSLRAFHNENLISELLEHRKVMEVLGNTLLVESTDNQLSGLGFNATVRDEILLRLKGTHNRVIKIKF